MLTLLTLAVLAQPQLVPQTRIADGGIAIRVWMDSNSINISGGGGGGWRGWLSLG